MNLINKTTFQEIEALGFVCDKDPEDFRGNVWKYGNDKFEILIDAWMDVSLIRKNPDTDAIIVKIDDLHDLRCLIDFIKD